MVKQLSDPKFLQINNFQNWIMEVSKAKFYNKTCNVLLNTNVVILTQHFEYRGGRSFENVAADGLVWKSNYSAIWVESDIRGIPHIHLLIFILDALKVTIPTIPNPVD